VVHAAHRRGEVGGTATRTIAAIATPPGTGGVALLRVSGPAAGKVAGLIFKSLKNKDFLLHPRIALLGHVHHPGQSDPPIDQALLTFFPAPASFTGEDVAELSVHGGRAIQAELLAAALAAGALLAEPGEFTRQAFLNGRMDLAQAEAVALLIGAGSERARRLLLSQAEGAMGKAVARLRSELLAAQALVTAVLDFPEDAGDVPLGEAWSRVERVEREAEELVAGAREGIGLAEGFVVVLSGPPNAGKSSLFNRLLGEERAIVHRHPGTTRDPVEGNIVLEGLPVRLVDTAGERGEEDGGAAEAGEVEREGMRRSRRWQERADLVLRMVDASRPAGEGEGEESGAAGATEPPPALRVRNKADLLPRPLDLQGAHSEEEAEKGILVSALTGAGISELRAALRRALLRGEGGAGEGAVAVTGRQRAALEGVALSCRRVLDEAGGGAPLECVAVDLAGALHHLGELVGRVTPDEVLDAVFSRFCVGK
jgi:tRNA modification GTPase